MDRGEQTAVENGGVASRPDRPRSRRLRGLLIALVGASVVTTAVSRPGPASIETVATSAAVKV